MAYLFGKVIAVFDYVEDPDKMDKESRFWSLMWVVLAVGCGLAYFFMGLISTRVSYVSPLSRNFRFQALSLRAC